jgi:glutamate synthase (ferredoxin)
MAGERFAVRNSGVTTVVEGVGDHGCEYMTGGRVVILGTTGRNFGAGMSGGIAYVFDPEQKFESRCNMGMIGLEAIELPSEMEEVRQMIATHVEATESQIGNAILADWPHSAASFVKVMPHEYKRVLESQPDEMAA